MANGFWPFFRQIGMCRTCLTQNQQIREYAKLTTCNYWRLPQNDKGETIMGRSIIAWTYSNFRHAPKESLSNVTPSTPRRLPRRSQKPNTPSSPQLHLTLSNPGSRALIMQQTCRGSLSAVSKPIFASIHSFCSIFKFYETCTLAHRSEASMCNFSDFLLFCKIHFLVRGFEFLLDFC